MTRFARVLCSIYGAAALFLAFATVQQALYGEVWAVAALAACSLVPLIALVRETEHADTLTVVRTDTERASRLRDRTEQRSLRAAADALGHACCERWWTSFGTDHDPSCRNQQRSRTA
ncbi:hypothetical protein [Streptomyces scabiei]|uniref:hypothetical protein n=1 Tax=Streptomyces scabiei TaxID=1930 RepID=UPI0004E74C3E|nr:hypothetical protein [Streptomyces scabiei]KFG07537.1 hypothetical protein IQ61_18965 [Streptomyces scabiei]MDX3679480.1 hypothetical protein [Streptomyces scabiei]